MPQTTRSGIEQVTSYFPKPLLAKFVQYQLDYDSESQALYHLLNDFFAVKYQNHPTYRIKALHQRLSNLANASEVITGVNK
jgi:hypothetical protein